MIFDYQFRNYNFRALIYMILLSVLGILVVGSASNQDRSSVIKQIIGVVVSLIICLVLSLIDYHQYFRFTTLIYVVCAGMLAAVLLFGRTTKGATRWLRIGGIQIQPSEFVKIGLILILANFLSRNRDKINEPKTLGMTALICALPVGMVYLQPNLSTTIVICFMILCMVYVAGISYKWIAGAVAVGVPGFAALIYLSLQGFIPFLQKYKAQRIMGKIFQLRGKGLFNNTLSSVKNGNFLSEEQTDFIFAVIGEELGFVGGVAVIALYALLVYECLWIAARAKDTAGRLIASGMAALLAFQSFANIAVATGIFPNTGLPLPFISSGLSSLLSMFIGMGVVLNVGLQRNNVTVQ